VTQFFELICDGLNLIRKAKAAIKKAFEIQQQGLGFSFVEILSTCPTNWKKSPQDAHKRVREEMMPVYVPGVYKDITAVREEK
jgi:2-oxoglutarate ferredoxin oxidoreductase subunit beta